MTGYPPVLEGAANVSVSWVFPATEEIGVGAVALVNGVVPVVSGSETRPDPRELTALK